MRVASAEGRDQASSNELVCKDWAPPRTAANASIALNAIEISRYRAAYGSIAYTPQ